MLLGDAVLFVNERGMQAWEIRVIVPEAMELMLCLLGTNAVVE